MPLANLLGMDHYFLLEGGLPFLGLADNFFQRVMCFKQFFFITFCNENNFLQTFLKTLQAFYRSYLKKKTHFLCMHTHEKSHLNETNSP